MYVENTYMAVSFH